ncbi:MAG TPA: hypothetical protein VL179_06575 [Mycobacterium sp.]|nr:hypothetical protein [Mycobacterium sp.]
MPDLFADADRRRFRPPPPRSLAFEVGYALGAVVGAIRYGPQRLWGALRLQALLLMLWMGGGLFTASNVVIWWLWRWQAAWITQLDARLRALTPLTEREP